MGQRESVFCHVDEQISDVILTLNYTIFRWLNKYRPLYQYLCTTHRFSSLNVVIEAFEHVFLSFVE